MTTLWDVNLWKVNMTPKNKTARNKSLDNYLYEMLESGELDIVGLKQFTTSDGSKFYPSGATVARITPGIYDIQVDGMKGIYFHKLIFIPIP